MKKKIAGALYILMLATSCLTSCNEKKPTLRVSVFAQEHEKAMY